MFTSSKAPETEAAAPVFVLVMSEASIPTNILLTERFPGPAVEVAGATVTAPSTLRVATFTVVPLGMLRVPSTVSASMYVSVTAPFLAAIGSRTAPDATEKIPLSSSLTVAITNSLSM